MTDSPAAQANTAPNAVLPGSLAGVYRRAVAFSVDQLLLLIVTYPLWLAFPAPPGEEAEQLRQALDAGPVPLDPAFLSTLQTVETYTRGPGPFALALSFIIAWLYFAWFESRARGATPGKYLTHMQVTDKDGESPSFLQAGLRALIKAGSILPNTLGLIAGTTFLIACFTPKKQALHDLLAQTFVVKNT